MLDFKFRSRRLRKSLSCLDTARFKTFFERYVKRCEIYNAAHNLAVRGFLGSSASLQVICHGIPDSYKLKDGDIINVDVTCYYGGYHGDCSEMFLVGDVDEAGRKLVRVTHEAWQAAIAYCKPGQPSALHGDCKRVTGVQLHRIVRECLVLDC